MKLIRAIALSLLAGIFAFQPNISQAQKTSPAVKEQTLMKGLNSSFNFTENKGQLADQDGKLLTDISYYGKQGGVNVYCRNGKISFVFTKVEGKTPDPRRDAIHRVLGGEQPGKNTDATNKDATDKDAMNRVSTITASRMDMEFLHANPNPQIIPETPIKTYTNYYLAHTPEEGITNVKSYKKLTYKNIYPNIDLVLETTDNGQRIMDNEKSAGASQYHTSYIKNHTFEYSFVVHPGGDPSNIKIHWSGDFKDNTLKPDGTIHRSNTLGEITESKPISFTTESTTANVLFSRNLANATNKVSSSTILQNDIISFKLGDYDNTKNLVIDPTLSWGTYFGGSGDDEAQGVTIDSVGNIFIVGTTLSTIGISTSGAFQTSLAGLGDVFIAKFTNSGNLYWSTYFGGNDDENGSGLSADCIGNIYITGTTLSSSGIATKGAYQTSYIYCEAFLAKFSSSGNRIWCTYYGGSLFESGNYVKADCLGNIYISGETESSTAIATKGAYQTSLAGYMDAFLAKFNSFGNLKWATYYGGSYFDGGNGITEDSLGNIYITGVTYSTSQIATKGAYQTSEQGGIGGDAFLAKFSISGNLSWATYYGGDSSDAGMAVVTDSFGDIYLAGSTSSNSGIATLGAYQTTYGGNADGFLAKFTGLGKRLWGTYYGGSSLEDVQGIVAYAGKLYLSGTTASSTGIATSNAFQNSFGGNRDAYLAQFSSGGALSWGTYFGGYGDDLGCGIAIDPIGNVFITGYLDTGSTSGIATSGSFQTAYAGGYRDAYLAKFNFPLYYNDAGISDIDSIPSILCTGTKQVYVTLSNNGSNTLSNATINWKINNKSQTTYSWSGSLASGKDTLVKIGNYSFSTGRDTIKIYSSNPNGITDSSPFNDTSQIVVNVHSPPSANTGLSQTVCNGSSVSIGASAITGNSYYWTSNPASFNSTQSNPLISPKITTTYYLTEGITGITGCSNIDSVVISVNPAPLAKTGSNSSICPGSSFKIGATSVSGNKYSWTSKPTGFTSTSSNPIITPTTTTTLYLTVKDTSTTCTNSDSVIITVNPKPTTPTISGPKSIASGSSATYSTTAITGLTYHWSVTGGTISGSANKDSVLIKWASAGSGSVKVVVTNTSGCMDSMQIATSIYTGVTNETTLQTELKVFPDPFRDFTNITYNLTKPAHVKIIIYSAEGKQVSTITDQKQEAGNHKCKFKPDNINGQGVYFIRMFLDDEVITKKVVKE